LDVGDTALVGFRKRDISRLACVYNDFTEIVESRHQQRGGVSNGCLNPPRHAPPWCH